MFCISEMETMKVLSCSLHLPENGCNLLTTAESCPMPDTMFPASYRLPSLGCIPVWAHMRMHTRSQYLMMGSEGKKKKIIIRTAQKFEINDASL